MLLVLVILLIGATVTAAGWPALHHSTTAVPAVGAAAGAPSAAQVDTEKGKRVYLKDCAYCHADDATGTALGPDLSTVGTAAVDFYLSTGRMPLSSPDAPVTSGPPAYSAETIRDIVGYLETLITGPSVPTVGTGDLKKGRPIFLANCAPCHSSSGTGMVLPNGVFAPELFGKHPKTIEEAVRIGPGSMPAFPPTALTKDDVNNLAAYVQHLGHDQDRVGHPLDYLGPIAEGMVLWLVPLPILILLLLWLGKRAP